ncbi:MAG TPA: alcohol dehydrogenase catalytic domain-containing protein [Acidimicrobiales bacterium]|nr:alcohol dehydrogenase catalytic domain-containing protein [Acidimicrobiales bacterium]HJM97071.1 alcohol dehydrogenase catalytic domain-containing protein [Acidimicrobiales bacterium]
MKAMVLRSGELRIDQVPDPTPQSGQIIVKSLCCCICASDLHMVHHAERLATWSREHGGPFDFDPDKDVVLGHEFCGEIVAVGADLARGLSVGDRVVSQPVVFGESGFAVLGYSNEYPGGFGEYLALSESLVLPVPEHMSNETAALVEPLSVGIQYARIANIQDGESPIVIGCGAIGLAVIAAFKEKGIGPVIASDFSPFRRSMAEKMGADKVVDPSDESPIAVWDQATPTGTGCVVVECVGAPGVLGEILISSPWSSRIIVAGQNLEDDTFFTASAHTKGLNVQFGGSPIASDYSNALSAISTGNIDVSAWQTGHVDLDGAIEAIADSTDTERHTRIAIHPHGVDASLR